MKFKLVIENNNIEKDNTQVFAFEMKPGVEVVAHFFGFAVCMTKDGCVLVLPSDLRKNIKNMKPGEDRLLCVSPDHPKRDEVHQQLLDTSLKWYPKDEVDPK